MHTIGIKEVLLSGFCITMGVLLLVRFGQGAKELGWLRGLIVLCSAFCYISAGIGIVTVGVVMPLLMGAVFGSGMEMVLDGCQGTKASDLFPTFAGWFGRRRNQNNNQQA